MNGGGGGYREQFTEIYFELSGIWSRTVHLFVARREKEEAEGAEERD